MATECKKKAIIALDIGTRYSGYAYHVPNSEPHAPDQETRGATSKLTKEDIQVCNRWSDTGSQNEAFKVPTHVLLDKDGNFKEFGQKAFQSYFENEDKTNLFFENFKMELYSESDEKRDLSEIKLRASNGETFPALDVFAAAMEFLKDHAMDLIETVHALTLKPHDVLWVLTTPAIWSITAKFFMRKAAYKAGLVQPGRPDNLLISLEPESAALYCRHLPVTSFAQDTQSESEAQDKVLGQMSCGTTYVIIDAGGGTLDMTAQISIDDGDTVEEIVKASGGAHGGAEIDRAFERLLVDTFGENFMTKFRKRSPIPYQNILQKFEVEKQKYSSSGLAGGAETLSIPLPTPFHRQCRKVKEQTVEEAVTRFQRTTGRKDITMAQGSLVLKDPEGLFAPVVEKIQREVIEFIQQDAVKHASIFFLVGGFAPFLAPHLKPVIKQRFPKSVIPVPLDSQLAVVKGAVLFGNDPSVVAARIARQTYGIGVARPFVKYQHRESLRYYNTEVKEYYCNNIFLPLVLAGTKVKYGDQKTERLRALLSGGFANIYIYTGPLRQKDTLFTCDKKHFTKLEAMQLPKAKLSGNERPCLRVTFQIGGTELAVTVTKEDTQDTFYTEVAFDAEAVALTRTASAVSDITPLD